LPNSIEVFVVLRLLSIRLVMSGVRFKGCRSTKGPSVYATGSLIDKIRSDELEYSSIHVPTNPSIDSLFGDLE
jgi:hypothetical protein